MIDLLHIGGAPAYTFLLYLFSEHKDNQELLKNAINFLIKYFVRRNLTDIPATRDLDTIFIGLVDFCEMNKKQLSIRIIMEYLMNQDRFSNLNLFEEKLTGNIYEENADVVRFILCKIEETHQTKEIFSDLWMKDEKNKFVWTIEHVFPEGDNIPKKWIEMIASGNRDEAEIIKEKWVHKLGNLTLTGYNQNLSNLSFEEKKERKDHNGKDIGYRNGLYLNRDIVDEINWTENHIRNRTRKLVDEAINLFKTDNEGKNITSSIEKKDDEINTKKKSKKIIEYIPLIDDNNSIQNK